MKLKILLLLEALRAALWTFRLTLLGWEVREYALPVWPGYGRCVGNLWRRRPTYPDDGPPSSTWRISSEGDGWPLDCETPVEAATALGSPMTVVNARLIRRRMGG